LSSGLAGFFSPALSFGFSDSFSHSRRPSRIAAPSSLNSKPAAFSMTVVLPAARSTSPGRFRADFFAFSGCSRSASDRPIR
jgi:hypothetical protein